MLSEPLILCDFSGGHRDSRSPGYFFFVGIPIVKSKLYLSVLFILAGSGILMMLANSRRLPRDQAGFAYVEGANGELSAAGEERKAERTVVPDRKKNLDKEWLTKFRLTERSGKQMGSDELKGKPYVAGFFFTNCPTICVNQNKKVEVLQDKYRDKPIRFISISVDPEVDRPEVLQQYANRFSADKDQWLFFTGDMDYIGRVGSEFFSLGVLPKRHPEKFVLVTGEGKIHGYYTWSDPNQWLALQQDINKLLAQPGK